MGQVDPYLEARLKGLVRTPDGLCLKHAAKDRLTELTRPLKDREYITFDFLPRIPS